MYQFVVSFIKKNCPRLSMDDVRFFATNQFLNQTEVERLGFKNAMFIIDQYHLQKSGLEDHFTSAGYDIVQEYVKRLIKSRSESMFNATADAARDLLQKRNPRDGNLESKL